jgi:CheY-like chemotaxis protein
VNKLKILVIDDKKIIGDLFSLTLGSRGHEIIWEKDEYTALELIKGQNFDLIFLDIIMPEEDGVSVLKMIKDIKPKIPVVMMSGYSVEEKRHNAMILGAELVLKKPFEFEDLQKVIKDVLEKDI